jgi:hypothetical protein
VTTIPSAKATATVRGSTRRPDSGSGVDRAEGDRRANREAGFGAGGGVDSAGDLGGIAEAGQAVEPDHVPGVAGIPFERVDVEQRREVGRGVAVDHVLAGEPVDDVVAGGVDHRRPGEDVGLVVAQPANLGTDGLGVEGHPAEGEDRLFPDLGVELRDFGGGAGIDPVEHAGAEGATSGVEREHAWPDSADGHRADIGPGVPAAGEGAGDGHELAPPEGVGIVLGPAGAGKAGVVLDHVAGEHGAIGRAEHAFRARRSDIDAQQ